MYFDHAGPENTQQVVDLALHTAKERGISHIVVASYSGDTALRFTGQSGVTVVCVTGAWGADMPGEPTMESNVRHKLESAGIAILSTSHVLSGVERGLSGKAGGMYPAEIMANTLRMLGQGSKVCVECAIMAVDTGLIPYGAPVIAIGGSDHGADTALILTPAHAKEVLNTKIHEIICKPYEI